MTTYPLDTQIDHDFNARESVPSFDTEYGALLTLSETARKALPCASDLIFDPATGMALDLYGIAPGRPVFLWIHGGYWRIGTKEGNAFAAPGLVTGDVAVAVMDYALAPKASLADIVHQVRLAIAWLKRKGPALGLDTAKIHVGGSSAGGHLTGMALAGGWHSDYGLEDHIIGAALSLSGIYDLEPLLYTQVNGWMHMDMQTVADLSPIRHIPQHSDARLILSVGGEERDGFIRETVAYARAWQDAGHQLKSIDMPTFNHFDITGTLSEPTGILVRETLKAIRSYRA